MEFLLENALNLLGFLVGLAIGLMSYRGFQNTGSPTLFRLCIAFLAIGFGFFIIWAGYTVEDLILHNGAIERWVQTLGIGVQTVGYFFIAFSHGIKSFFPKNRYLRSIVPLPLLITSTIPIEHILRATSFILLVYGAIETLLSFLEGKKGSAALVSAGLVLLAFGEFLGWYSFVFPETILYYVSVSVKIAGLALLFAPFGRSPATRMRLGRNAGGPGV